jgi:hypothetical protein
LLCEIRSTLPKVPPLIWTQKIVTWAVPSKNFQTSNFPPQLSSDFESALFDDSI